MAGSVSNSSLADTAKDEMGDVVVNIRSTIDIIQDVVARAKSGWQGEASAAFVQACDAWDAEAVKVKGILDEMGTKVGVGAKQLRDMDSSHDFGGLKL